jgi:hypothetical protein
VGSIEGKLPNNISIYKASECICTTDCGIKLDDFVNFINWPIGSFCCSFDTLSFGNSVGNSCREVGEILEASGILYLNTGQGSRLHSLTILPPGR